MAKGFEYTVDSNFDYTIDEKGNTFIALRKIDWGNNGNFKLDLRKYYASENGETMSKGVSFLTEDGPDELTKVLLDNGYGDNYAIANSIIENRPEVLLNIYNTISENPELIESAQAGAEFDETSNEKYYDPEELIA